VEVATRTDTSSLVRRVISNSRTEGAPDVAAATILRAR
jgi:hypothetical protein